MSKKPRHGGNLRIFSDASDRSPENILDFSANINPFTVKIAIFGLLIVLLSLKGEYISTRAGTVSSAVVLFLYSFLNAGLVVSSTIYFMDDVARESLLSQSHIADLIFKFNNWWIALPAIVLIVAGFKKRSYTQQPE